MSSDHLVIELSDVLRDALRLPADQHSFDYFTFLGLKRNALTDEAIEKAVLRRSKALRMWQNSPHHSEESIKLLPAIHRVAKVLRDPTKREAYTTELDRIMSGETEEPREVFESMVRTALADGVMDRASRVELLRFATSQAIEDAEEIIARESEVSRGARTEAASEEKAISFDDYDAGAEGFRRAVKYLLTHGRLTAESGAKAVGVSSRFGVEVGQAQGILDETRSEYFNELAENSARGGVLSNNQARLLMPKAKALGLNLQVAYDIVSEYTFTNVSQDDLSEMRLASAGFDDTEIETILESQETVYYTPRLTLAQKLAGWPLQTLKVLIVVAVVGGGGYWFYDNFLSYWVKDIGSILTGGKQEVVDEATPEPEEWKPPKADPSSGRILLRPKTGVDPNPFEIRIREVSRDEYQEFLNSSLYPSPPPLGWSDAMDYPEGTGDYPVTGISWRDSMAYCDWVGKRFRVRKGGVRLPTAAEYDRVLAESLPDDMDPQAIDFSRKTEFYTHSIGARGEAQYDTFLADFGQIYDLLGNAAEWGMDREDDKMVVLGGHYSVGEKKAKLTHTRYVDPRERSEVIGFRYVISPPLGN